MHSEVLTEEQRKLLPLIGLFSNDYYLVVGGTAIALYIGHRRSIDFDLFTTQDIKRKSIRNLIDKSGFTVDNLLYEAFDQIHLVANHVDPNKVAFNPWEHDEEAEKLRKTDYQKWIARVEKQKKGSSVYIKAY